MKLRVTKYKCFGYDTKYFYPNRLDCIIQYDLGKRVTGRVLLLHWLFNESFILEETSNEV